MIRCFVLVIHLGATIHVKYVSLYNLILIQIKLKKTLVHSHTRREILVVNLCYKTKI